MSTRTQLSSAIAFKLRSLTDFFDTDTVLEYSTFNVKGTPAVLVLPDRNEAEYDTNLNNVRTYAFLLVVLQQLDGDMSVEGAYARMREVEDAIIDEFDRDPQFLDIEDLNLPSHATFIDTFASPSSWIQVEAENNRQFLIAEIQLRIKIDISLE